MTAFDTRLRTNLFPEMPDSFSNGIHAAMRRAGVRPKTAKPFWIASTAVASVAVAASMLLVLISVLRGNQHHEASPIETASVGAAQAPLETGVPLASAEPAWAGTTAILSAVDPDGRYTEEDAEHTGRVILSFLRELGESEPEELWILRIKPMFDVLPEDDAGSHLSNLLVLAQSKFGVGDGPDLYCVQKHADGEVLWGTVDGSSGPHRVLAKAHGQQRWIFFGSNTSAAGESLGHITAGCLTGGEPGTDVEFGAILSTDQAREPFKASRYYRQLGEYYVLTDGMSDLNRSLDLSLMLVTADANYIYPIRTEVPEMGVVTAEEAAAMRQRTDALTLPTEAPYEGETVIRNLTDESDERAAAYTDAILAWLKNGGIKPKALWICADAPFAFPEENPTDEAYVLAQYEFEGESGPELFYFDNGTIRWQTKGYDPFAINTVYDPIKDQNCVFGASPYYDNGPVPVQDGAITCGTDEWSQTNDFSVELPLETVLARLNGDRAKLAREFFICPYPKNSSIRSLTFTAQNGDIYAPALDTLVTLPVHDTP